MFVLVRRARTLPAHASPRAPRARVRRGRVGARGVARPAAAAAAARHAAADLRRDAARRALPDARAAGRPRVARRPELLGQLRRHAHADGPPPDAAARRALPRALRAAARARGRRRAHLGVLDQLPAHRAVGHELPRGVRAGAAGVLLGALGPRRRDDDGRRARERARARRVPAHRHGLGPPAPPGQDERRVRRVEGGAARRRGARGARGRARRARAARSDVAAHEVQEARPDARAREAREAAHVLRDADRDLRRARPRRALPQRGGRAAAARGRARALRRELADLRPSRG